MRLATVLFSIFTIFIGVVLFHTKHKVALLEEEIGRYEKQLRQEREAVSVLQAEWSYLAQPRRLQKLADQFLMLRSPKVSQHIESKELIKMCIDLDHPASSTGEL